MDMVTLNVGIFVYDDVEVLDFAGPFQVFTTAQPSTATERGACQRTALASTLANNSACPTCGSAICAS